MVSLASGWNVPLGSTTSPDYFNTCAPIASDLNVPFRLCDTLADFVLGDSGYAGMLFRDSLTSVFVVDWYEYITTHLAHRLWPAVNYHLSFLVANKRFASFNSNIGAAITRNPMVQSGRHPIPYPIPTTHEPYFNSDTEITVTSWQWLNFNFRTDTCELQYLTIGRFYQDTIAIDTNPRPRPAIYGGHEHYCYYFIDDVSITGNEPSTHLPYNIALCDSGRIAADTGYFTGFQWYKNGAAIAGATHYYYYATTPGRYYVRLTLPICGTYVYSDTTIAYIPREIMHLDFKSTSCTKSYLNISFDSGIAPVVEWTCPVAINTVDSSYHYRPIYLRSDTLNLVHLHIDYGGGCIFDTALYIYPCCETPNTIGLDSSGIIRVSYLLAYYDANSDGRITGAEFAGIYNLDGFLYIDTNIIFDSMEFKMQVDAGMIINKNRTLTINNSFIHACGNRMWNGIYVMDSTKTLYLTNNKIADAKEAIHTEKNGKIVVKNNIFDVNYKSIVMQNYWGTYQDTIKQNQFLCQTIPSYIVYSTLLAPYTGQRSYLGIDVQNVKSMNIGETGGASVCNRFDNLNNGIYTYMSGGNIRNNQMINIINSTFTGKAINVKGDNSINAYNLVMKIGLDSTNQNKLTGCTYGIELEGMASEVLYNDFNNNFQAIRFINTSSISFTSSPSSFFNTRIHHNTIDTLKGFGTADGIGINIDQVYYTIKSIDNNKLTNPSFTGSTDLLTKSAGILSNNTFATGSGNFEANDNIITNIRLGIKVLNGDSMYIHNNTISNTMTFPTLNKVGINLTNTQRSRVDCNTVSLRFATGTQDLCIGLQASPNNRIRKNMLNNANMAMRFNGDCTSNDQVWGNIMTNFNYYVTRSTFGKIGKQSLAGPTSLFLPGNKFLPTSSLPRLYSMNNSTDTVQTFRYNSLAIYSAYATIPSTRDSVTSRVISVISTSVTNPYTWTETPGACGTLPYLVNAEDTSNADSSGTEMAMMIIASDLRGTDEEITQNYEAKDYLYENMITDSNKYFWNATLNDFKDEYESSNANAIKEAEKQLSIHNLEDADNTLESISTPLDVMENMKDILNLQLDSSPIDSGTEKLAQVEAIAYTCPYSQGKAVYYARAMLISRYGNLEFDDDALCNTIEYDSHLRRFNPNPTEEDNEIEIVPNPVVNVFTVKNNTNREIERIEIFDMIGQHIYTAKTTTIDLSKYSTGRYLVKVLYKDYSETTKLFMKE